MTGLQALVARLGRPAVVAHRGASRRAPENSLAALMLARELGADAVEFDVQRCASGELVVFHDRTLARCTGRVGTIFETPLATLRTLTLDRLGRGRGERIPTLLEWLAAAPTDVFLNLEAKADVLAHTELAADCARMLVQHGRTRSAVLSAFHPAALVVSRQAAREVPRAVLVEGARGWQAIAACGLAAGARAIHPEHVLVTPARVGRWKRLGWQVAVWTVDEPDEARRCLEAGVDAIITNVPDLIRPIAERYRRTG